MVKKMEGVIYKRPLMVLEEGHQMNQIKQSNTSNTPKEFLQIQMQCTEK